MTDERIISRRRLLGGLSALAGLGSLRSSPYEDEDGDGIPDDLERSESHHEMLTELFGADQFAGLDPGRKDLLVDARYVGSATISSSTKRFLEQRFRQEGIHLQWLDYPIRYDPERIAAEYGFRVERLLWPYASFYWNEIEDAMKDIAIQIITLPIDGRDLESVYTIHRGRHFEGVSFGNRCLVTEQSTRTTERRLVMHEIGHLALCHNEDRSSVMAPSPDHAQFTADEWDVLRDNLPNVRDATGFDIAYRRCIISEYGNVAFESIDAR